MRTLKGFFQDYLKWVEDGAPDYRPFARGAGLCHNVAIYTGDFTYAGANGDSPRWELLRLLRDEFTDYISPFNGTDGIRYGLECAKKQCHNNPERLAFVRKHAWKA